MLEYKIWSFFLIFRHDLVPIVMGARPQDYERAAPYKSYIHVDDFEGPKELAEFLKQVESNDEVYNEYFRWKVISFIILLLVVQYIRIISFIRSLTS